MSKQWQAEVSLTMYERDMAFFSATRPVNESVSIRQSRFTVLVEESQEETLEEQALEEALSLAMGKRLGD